MARLASVWFSFLLLASLIASLTAADNNGWLIQMLITGASNAQTANAIGGCSEDALRCNGNVLEVCTGNKWVTQQNCAPGYCSNNQCHAAVPLTCTDGTKQCKDATTGQVCSGGVWVDDTSCAPGTTCQVTGPGTITCATPTCTSGDQRCADLLQVQLCVNGAWTNWQTCPAGQLCSNGNCVSSASYCDGTVADSCVDTQWLKHCDVPTNTWVQQNCDAQGKVCRNGVCADRITPLGCNPATDGAYCSGAGARTYCNANGQWATENCAGGQVCSNGACVSSGGGGGGGGTGTGGGSTGTGGGSGTGGGQVFRPRPGNLTNASQNGTAAAPIEKPKPPVNPITPAPLVYTPPPATAVEQPKDTLSDMMANSWILGGGLLLIVVVIGALSYFLVFGKRKSEE